MKLLKICWKIIKDMRIDRENQRMKLKNWKIKRPIRKSWMNNDQRFMIFPFKITKTNTNTKILDFRFMIFPFKITNINTNPNTNTNSSHNRDEMNPEKKKMREKTRWSGGKTWRKRGGWRCKWWSLVKGFRFVKLWFTTMFLLGLFHEKKCCNCFNFVPCTLWDFIVLGLVLSWWRLKLK